MSNLFLTILWNISFISFSDLRKAYQWQQGLGLLEFLRAHHVPLHFWSFSLLSACEKSARWRETLALATFQERAERTPVSAGDVGYAENAQISACEKAHLWVQAGFHPTAKCG